MRSAAACWRALERTRELCNQKHGVLTVTRCEMSGVTGAPGGRSRYEGAAAPPTRHAARAPACAPPELV
eukprot:6396875-Alexandrium_andersonii.AAC.1